MNVTIIQSELHWHDAGANRRMFDAKLASISESTDLVVLPEMFTTGFSMDAAALAEAMDGTTIEWMRRHAARLQATVCGSLIVRDHGNYFNRFVAAAADGNLVCYDKRHLFTLADEQLHYQPGNRRVVFAAGNFRVCPMVCYDLRFPVWTRNTGDYDMLVFVANWPSRRHQAWESLLRARAIENQCFVVGVNRVGTDGNALPYAGGSVVIDYAGNEVADLGSEAGLKTTTLDLASLEAFRQKFPFHRDADRFRLAD